MKVRTLQDKQDHLGRLVQEAAVPDFREVQKELGTDRAADGRNEVLVLRDESER